VANDICRSAVPALKYLPERRSTAFPHHYTPATEMLKISSVVVETFFKNLDTSPRLWLNELLSAVEFRNVGLVIAMS